MKAKICNFFRDAPTLLRKWRILKVGLTVYLCYLLYILMEWIMADPYSKLDGAVQSLVISALAIGFIAGLFKVVEKIDAPVEQDKIDK